MRVVADFPRNPPRSFTRCKKARKKRKDPQTLGGIRRRSTGFVGISATFDGAIACPWSQNAGTRNHSRRLISGTLDPFFALDVIDVSLVPPAI
jgi:hypothetical protein